MVDDEYVFYWASVFRHHAGKGYDGSTSLDVSKFKDGKAVEHWVFMDPKEMMAIRCNPVQAAQSKPPRLILQRCSRRLKRSNNGLLKSLLKNAGSDTPAFSL